MKKTIGIIFGGQSTEYSVSLESAYSVLSYIDDNKYDIYMIGINQKGEWLHFDGHIDMIRDDLWQQHASCHVMLCPEPEKQSIMEIKGDKVSYRHIDAIMPIMHGKNGEDGTLQGLIEISQIPLIGCDVLSSSLCMDKQRAHDLIAHHGIKVPKAVHLSSMNEYDYKKEEILKLHLPLYIKPVRSGSSYGISRIEDMDCLENAIINAFLYDNDVIIEEEIDGFEVGCAVMGINELTVGRVDEIELSSGFFNFEEKYTLKTSKIHMPARISSEMENKIIQQAKEIYKILGCRIFARVDMFLTKDNEIVFNEVNTIPGFTAHSRYPNMMKGIGIDFTALISQLIEMGLSQ